MRAFTLIQKKKIIFMLYLPPKYTYIYIIYYCIHIFLGEAKKIMLGKTLNWKGLYMQTMRPKSLYEKELMIKELCRQNKSIKIFVDEIQESNSKYEQTNYSINIKLLDVAGELLPIQDAEKFNVVLENQLNFMYSDYNIENTMTGVCRFILSDLTNRPRKRIDSRYIWCVIFSHMLAISRTIDDKFVKKRRAHTSGDAKIFDSLMQDAMFVVAKYVGDVFTDFLYMLKTLDSFTVFLPPTLLLLVNNYLDILNTKYDGKVPADFIVW